MTGSVTGGPSRTPSLLPNGHARTAPPEVPAYTPTEFHLDGGSLAMTTGIGAVMGAGLFALGLQGQGDSRTLAAILGVGALIGGVVGFFGGKGAMHGGWEKDQAAKREASLGTPIADLAKQVMAPYDHSQDGTIQLVNDTGTKVLDERAQTETRRGSESHLEWDVLGDGDIHSHSQSYTESRELSGMPIWRDANANGDDLVEESEVEGMLSLYDGNHDQHLTTGEFAAYTADHAPITSNWVRNS